ncbi:substrate-binding domain-containing protein [Cellulomonas edaphi]|uniref:Substrate-binding domain-containing protein n=1 Tax=Cellulomonas edaphi TaxID=3053468 RepID=A0ABT7S8G4_9CELL|nr:substrate-binding domain-containing protein [Cellulomons edaphi]MDM7831918.1 substrate-binding domain-containing protein [Cellulomons edaphi]
MRGIRTRATAVVSLGLALMLLLGGCVQAPSPQEPSSTTIGLLLPESKAARYESTDRPSFEQTVAETCPDCQVLYANADQDAARQQQQAESMLTRGAGVLVLDAVDATGAVTIVQRAAARGVPVIAYDRFIAGAPIDYFVGVDGVRVGRLQGEALAAALADRRTSTRSARAGILAVHGSTTDPNAARFKAGFEAALVGTPVDVLASYDTPDWSPDKTQAWVSDQLTQFGHRVDGVYAANDAEAGGAISAMIAAGFDPVPPVTGQDAELAAIQRIVSGTQLMTVYRAIAEQSRTAAQLAVRVVRGEQPTATSQLDGIPALFLTPVAVDLTNVRRVIIDGGVYTTKEICVTPYAEACARAGLLDGASR